MRVVPVVLVIAVCWCAAACGPDDSVPDRTTTVPSTNSFATVANDTYSDSPPTRSSEPPGRPYTAGNVPPSVPPAIDNGDGLPPTAVISPGEPLTGAGIPTSITPLPAPTTSAPSSPLAPSAPVTGPTPTQ